MGLEWMEDRGIVAEPPELSWYDGVVILNKNDHLKMLIERKRRAMATRSSQCLKSYNISAYDVWNTPLYRTVMWRNLVVQAALREVMLTPTKMSYGGNTSLHEAASDGGWSA